MILIISHYDDPSTNDFIRWCIYYNLKYLRINREETVNKLNFSITSYKQFNFEFLYRNKKYSIKDFDFLYFRRGQVSLDFNYDNLNVQETYFINREYKTLETFIYFVLKSKIKSIGSFEKNSLNKLEVLCLASEVGLKIPKTEISSSFSIEKFNQNHITKNISEVFDCEMNDFTYSSMTYQLSEKVNYPSKYSYSLIQDCINKKWEIRSFYLDGTFYSSAIFSQKNKKTMVDYRDYDDELPNRVVSYKLPREIEEKLDMLFNKINLNIGSIDLIFDGEDYFFLEINPVGQYGMISVPCNYALDKELLKYLIDKKNGRM